jgi:hypothetical protein
LFPGQKAAKTALSLLEAYVFLSFFSSASLLVSSVSNASPALCMSDDTGPSMFSCGSVVWSVSGSGLREGFFGPCSFLLFSSMRCYLRKSMQFESQTGYGRSKRLPPLTKPCTGITVAKEFSFRCRCKFSSTLLRLNASRGAANGNQCDRVRKNARRPFPKCGT